MLNDSLRARFLFHNWCCHKTDRSSVALSPPTHSQRATPTLKGGSTVEWFTLISLCVSYLPISLFYLPRDPVHPTVTDTHRTFSTILYHLNCCHQKTAGEVSSWSFPDKSLHLMWVSGGLARVASPSDETNPRRPVWLIQRRREVGHNSLQLTFQSFLTVPSLILYDIDRGTDIWSKKLKYFLVLFLYSFRNWRIWNFFKTTKTPGQS